MPCPVLLKETESLGSVPAATAAVQSRRDPLIREARRFKLDTAVRSTWFAQDTAIFVSEDCFVMRVPAGGAESLISAHEDIILAAAADGKQVATAGADGRIVALDAAGQAHEIATLQKSQWVTGLAIGAHGTAWAIGRNVFMQTFQGSEKSYESRSTVSALAFSPDGVTLALSTKEGLIIWQPLTGEHRSLPAGFGVAVGLNFSPDGRFIAESFYEPGASIRDANDGGMILLNGPTARVGSMSWAPRADLLLTSGARQLMIWPIAMQQGRLASLPRLFAPYSASVTGVAHHPSEPIAAVGYQDGMVLLVRLQDGAEIVLKPGGAGAISGITWNQRGNGLAIGGLDGDARLFAIDFQ